jgi:hypothetical protein
MRTPNHGLATRLILPLIPPRLSVRREGNRLNQGTERAAITWQPCFRRTLGRWIDWAAAISLYCGRIV